MVEVVVRPPDADHTIRPFAPRSFLPYESVNVSAIAGGGEHVYLSVNGATHKVSIGVPQSLSSSEIVALRDSGFTVTESGG